MNATRPVVEPREILTLDGQLLHVRYRHPTTGWCLGRARFVDQGTSVEVTVVGALSDIALREKRIFYGYWDTHEKYGEQFHVQASRRRDPLTANGMMRYLATAHCTHLGEKTAQKLVDRFGDETLKTLREAPENVAAMKGISLDRAKQWQTFFLDQQGADEVIVWLLQWDIDPSVARRLYAKYQADAMARVQSNPYALTQSTWGVGFRTADRMALSMGLEPLSPERLEAVWRFGLETALTQGDCYQTTDQLIDRAVELLDDQNPHAVQHTLTSLQNRLARLPDVVFREDDNLWRLRWIDAMESRLAADVTAHPCAITQTPPAIDWAWLRAKTGLDYAPAQQNALNGVLNAPYSIITGGPGTGKTTILNGLLTWLIDHEHVRPDAIALAAPTARAAAA